MPASFEPTFCANTGYKSKLNVYSCDGASPSQHAECHNLDHFWSQRKCSKLAFSQPKRCSKVNSTSAHWKVPRATCKKFGESSPKSYPNYSPPFEAESKFMALISAPPISFETLQRVATYQLQGRGATNDLRCLRCLFSIKKFRNRQRNFAKIPFAFFTAFTFWICNVLQCHGFMALLPPTSAKHKSKDMPAPVNGYTWTDSSHQTSRKWRVSSKCILLDRVTLKSKEQANK